ncbi:type IV pilus secretin PilQ family protein [Halopseudomonas nanhaiensis]|uniref:type IV pilus secretin PilQ family protein n=1 Tax=Halopseudomonas nanhaiensis TaxID=2830842 RepID=UPI001CBC8676|nr:type IV pilus secretin PilQ family protein [Halopseudomonas nanhaiensis]UAW98718.1 type IV pilus secretin PilQ family protein [Halopseudomonas nanhaiensis]
MPLTRKFSLAAVLAVLSPWVAAADLQKLDVASLPGERVELKLTFDEPVATPKGYTIEQPARIALDLPGVKNKLGERGRELGLGNARSLNIVEANDRTRLIVNLTNLAPYTTRVEGNNLFILVGTDSAPGYSAPATASAGSAASASSNNWRSADQPAVSSAAASGGKAIRSLDFQRGEQGEGNVIIDLSDPSIRVDVDEQGGRVRLNFPDTRLPDELRVRLDVKDFATPVNFINASTSGGNTTINIEPSGYFEHLVYQAEDRLIVSFKPLSRGEVEQRRADEFAYTGEKLSLNFQNIEVRSVLQLIADFTDLNLVASDTVEGSITLRLQNVPWDQALDLVLKTKGLDKRRVGNVLLVAPADEIAARERQELESQRQIAELAPLRRELIQVNYARAADIAKLFASVTAGAQGEQRGSITVDDRTNSIIALETQDKLDELRRIVTQLDIPVRQVMIEARIVEANVGFDKALGVRWGGNVNLGSRFNAYGKDGNMGVVEDPNPVTVTDPITGATTEISRNTAGFIGIPEIPLNTPFVDMGVAGATSGIGIGFITNNAILDLQLSAMESTGNGEIISQPKVVTSDKETAKILKGSEIPYQEASSSGATTTAFAEAVLSLEVTPQITPDNQVIMEVVVTKDEPDFTNEVNGVPTIRKNEVNAKILVADGETIVIGGVFSSETQQAQEKVPFLGDLPVVGRAFRRDITSESKTELLVFLTPRIINNGAISVAR